MQVLVAGLLVSIKVNPKYKESASLLPYRQVVKAQHFDCYMRWFKSN